MTKKAHEVFSVSPNITIRISGRFFRLHRTLLALLLCLSQGVNAQQESMFFFGLEVWNRVNDEAVGGGWGACANTGLGGQIAGSQITPTLSAVFTLKDSRSDGSIDVWAKIVSLDGKQVLQKKFLQLSSPSENTISFDIDGVPYEFKLIYRKLAGDNYDDCFVGRARAYTKQPPQANPDKRPTADFSDDKPLVKDARDEVQIRTEVSKEIEQLFFNSSYTELNRRSAEYLQKELRTPSGLWMSTLFQDSIARAIHNVAHSGMEPKGSAWEMLDDMVNKWIKASPQFPAAHLARAQLLITHAWALRGNNWAKDVPKDAWEPFHRYVEQAENYLLEHKNVAGKDPNWYAMMFSVAAAQQWERNRYEQLLEEALAKAPTFYQNYFNALAYLLPKWGGNAAEIELFADHAVELTRATEGNAMYARIYWFAAQSQYTDANLLSDSKVSWEKMKAGLEDVMKKYPDRWNLNNYAKFSCEARDHAKTKELMKKIGDDPMMMAWRSEAIFEECQRFRYSVPPVTASKQKDR